MPCGSAKEPMFLVNASGLTSLEKCEEAPGLAHRINAEAVGEMAAACAKKEIRFVHFSTDYVFDGNAAEPYAEDAPAAPLGVYGKSKLRGEQAALAANPDAYVFRVSWVFGPHRPAFPDMILERALHSESVEAVCDKFASPTYTHDIAFALSPLFDASPPAPGLYHFCNTGVCSWVEYARHALECAQRVGLPVRTTEPVPVSLASLPALSAPRPVYSALATAKFARAFAHEPRSWREALADHVAARATQFSKL
jgi:dTDP-4-dehydrorhamnose reductase